MKQTMWYCIPFKKCSDFKVIAFGNVLVSYTAYLEHTQLLDFYKLSMNTRGKDVDVTTLCQIPAGIIANKQECKPKLGGSAMNTVCILKTLGTNALCFGACGKDDKLKIIYEFLKNTNMDRYHFKLQTISDTAAGRRISLMHKDSKSLYSNDGASAKFTGTYLQQAEKEENDSFLRPLKRKQIFYIEGFFVPKCKATFLATKSIQKNGRCSYHETSSES